jgi:hypothetical protein
MLVFAAVAGLNDGAGWGELVNILGMLGGATALSLTAKSLREPGPLS